MSDTTSSVAGNSDAPVASVNSGFGPTEIAHYIVILGSLLASTGLHSDLGLTKNAANLAPLVLLGATVSLGIMRGIKHHGAMKFNAMTYLGQLQHVANVVASSGGSPTSIKALTAGVSALNGAIQQDFPTTGAAAVSVVPVLVAVPAPDPVPDPVPPQDPVPVVPDPVPVVVPAPDSVPVPVPVPAPDPAPAPDPSAPIAPDVPVPARVVDAQPEGSSQTAVSARTAATSTSP